MNTTFWFAFLTGVTLKSGVVLAAAWLASVLLRGRSASARHLVWTAALAGVLLLPLFSASLPAWRVPAFATLPPGFAAMFQIAATDNLTTPGGSFGTTAPTSFKPAWRLNWRLAIVLVWSLGIAASLSQLLVSYMALWRVRRTARLSPHQQLADQLGTQLDLLQHVRLLETAEGTMPMTCGVLRPAILMPRDAARWTEDRRRIVLLHELAHVRRADVATHILARLALTLHWWNPLAWIAWRGFLKERERATDDLVLNSGARASDYAGHLLDVARGFETARILAPAALAMARRSELEGRLVAILDSRLKRGIAGRASALAAVFAAVVLIAPFAALHAQPAAPQARHNDRESTSAAMHQGIIALRDKHYAQAIEHFQQAQIRDPKEAGRAQMWLAVANERESNASDADALYRSALALADPGSSDSATVMELYSRFLKSQGRTDEATPMADRARELRKFPAPATTAVHIGAGVSPPTVAFKLQPQYTDEARAAKYEGTVVLFVEVGTDGIPGNIQVVRGLGLGLNESAVKAVSQWKFKPARKNGDPVTVQATIEVNFRLL